MRKTTVPTTPNIQVIERMFTLIDVLASREEAISLKEISERTGRHPSTAHRILNDVARARAEIQPTDGPVSGIVTIGLLASTSDLLATVLAAEVARRYPHIRLRLTIGYAGHLQDWLEAGDVDAALLYGRMDTPALHVKTLLEENLWVVAPPSAKLSRDQPLQFSHVAQQPFILPAAPQGLRALIEHAATEAGVTLQVFAETNALSVQKALVTQGHGWTILPVVGVATEVERGLLSADQLAEILRPEVLTQPNLLHRGKTTNTPFQSAEKLQ